MYIPFSYQTECLGAVESVRNRGLPRALIVMASGLGKTVTMAFDAQAFRRRQQGARVLFLCHNNNILYQAKTTFEAVNGAEHTYGYFHGEEKHLHPVDFLFASLQSMNLAREFFSPTEFSYIVVDESHHSQADTFRAVIEYFRPQFILGATATPERLDMLDIREIFGREVYSLPLEEAMARGFVTPVDYRLLSDEIVLNDVLDTDGGGRVSLAELNRKIFIPRRDEEIAKILARHTAEIDDPRVMIFCTSIKHCEHLSHFIPDSFAIHSGLPVRERAVKLEMFRQGLIGTVLVVDAFNEGIDIPQANVVVFLRSTTSRTIFLQQLGRGLRKSDGKDKVLALDFVANCDRIKMVHSLWRHIEDTAAQFEKDRAEGGEMSEPMTLNVNTVEFQETIVPLLRLMDRVRPLRISEVEHLAKEYSPRNTIPPDLAYAGSNERYWWTCSKCGHEWQATGSSRHNNGTGCPACAGRLGTPLSSHPALLAEYSSRNSIPATEARTSNKKSWWQCSKCGHEWEAPSTRRIIDGRGCPKCSGNIGVSLSDHPDLAAEYSSRNPTPVSEVKGHKNQRLWWHCSKCGHDWQARLNHRVRDGRGCPACAGLVVTDKNNLAATHPALAAEYSDRNPLLATEVIVGTNQNLWWKCSNPECGHEWQAKGHRRKAGSGCPKCSRKKGAATRRAHTAHRATTQA